MLTLLGKTTMMNVLSGRHGRYLNITGDVYLNDCVMTRSQRALTGLIGHVEQQELFIETITLEEHLVFQAMLRMPQTMKDTERLEHVENTMQQLNLVDCRNTSISRLSGGEKKRLGFATALLTRPQVVLIDEPTSGLDTFSAKSLMKIIRSMAVEREQAIIVVLHQPTSAILDVIDILYFIVDGGRQAFYGTKTEAQQFFINQCQLPSMSLDVYIEKLSAPASIVDDQSMILQEIAVQQYGQSVQCQILEKTIENHLKSIDKHDIPTVTDILERSSFGRQLKWLLWRSLLSAKRNSKRTTNLFFRLVIMAIILGVLFLHSTRESLDYIVNIDALLFALFMSLLESNMSLTLVEIPNEREMVVCEYRRHLYSVGAYYISRLIIDTCFHVISATVYISIIAAMTDLHHWIILVCLTILIVMTACASAALIAALSSSARTALLYSQPIQNLFRALTGFFINLHSLPVFLRWLPYISYMHYAYQLILVVQWWKTNLIYPCDFTTSPKLTTNSTLFSNDTCSISGIDIITCFHSSYRAVGYNMAGLISFLFGFHILAFIIIFYRIRRAL
ncbi:unnamed protein product [Rotaria magnacalcarata]|uniref:ABC transporter domain-containing protein n=1 Tax=Rotaria magnacalcarata TaxID=392030 RepID=A0A816Q0G8_9BILA|nr:unnamed protein product [Rotaria magnacalcarata]CAF2058766.1 unnamed protein product [Rotaria magnacalcarata]CAF4129111.1 unnamed protein product [Rotaria magnacalcarata]CAF4252994.1 unnamed protein product [Rotaria magnacalcarata]